MLLRLYTAVGRSAKNIFPKKLCDRVGTQKNRFSSKSVLQFAVESKKTKARNRLSFNHIIYIIGISMPMLFIVLLSFCQAATLPMSIIIIGVGHADFSDMDILDGDDIRVSHNGNQVVQSDYRYNTITTAN